MREFGFEQTSEAVVCARLIPFHKEIYWIMHNIDWLMGINFIGALVHNDATKVKRVADENQSHTEYEWGNMKGTFLIFPSVKSLLQSSENKPFAQKCK